MDTSHRDERSNASLIEQRRLEQLRTDQPVVIVELRHGLCNRLCALVSARVAAQERGKDVRFIWHQNQSCNCAYSDLFADDLETGEATSLATFNDDCLSERDPIDDRLLKTMFYGDLEFRRFEKHGVSAASIHNLPFFSGRVDDAALSFHRELNALPIRADVTRRLALLPTSTIGVHIRRTDHAWKTPDEWYFDRMDEQLTRDDTTQFFLATDDRDIRKRLRKRYGRRVESYGDVVRGRRRRRYRHVHRSSARGMRDALRDLVSLSRTQRIIGSDNSSFTWLASIWGLVPFESPGCTRASGVDRASGASR